MTRDSAFTGTKVKNDDGTSSNADDIDLPAPKSEGKTNIYIGEKEDGETGAFDSIEGLNEFLTSSTPAVWPKDATTEPSNYNIYYYSTDKDSLWLWGGPGNTGLGASTTKKFGEYEEIVPHESLFFLYMLSNGTPSGDRSLERLLKLIDDNPLIQFGGNMTIGNGLTRVERWKSHE